MACDNTIQVLNGSTLTFKSEVQICDINNVTNLSFSDILQDGLTIDNTDTDVTVSYYATNNPAISGDLADADYTADFIDPTLTITVTPNGITAIKTTLDTEKSVNILVTIKAKVDDLNALMNGDDTNPNPNHTLSNTGTFTADGSSVDVKLNPEPTIEEYSPEVSGYSMTVCPSENEGKFNVKLCVNTICGDYQNGQYVLTIEPTDGISFPTEAELQADPTLIKAYKGCCCQSADNEITGITSELDDANLKITIPDQPVTDPADTDSCNDSISLSIPYEFENTTTACTNEPLIITGSMIFNTGNGTTTLAELKNFGLYVNVDCGNLVGISKTILC